MKKCKPFFVETGSYHTHKYLEIGIQSSDEKNFDGGAVILQFNPESTTYIGGIVKQANVWAKDFETLECAELISLLFKVDQIELDLVAPQIGLNGIDLKSRNYEQRYIGKIPLEIYHKSLASLPIDDTMANEIKQDLTIQFLLNTLGSPQEGIELDILREIMANVSN